MPLTEAQQGIVDAGLAWLFEDHELTDMVSDARVMAGTNDVALYIEVENGEAIARSSTRQELLNAFLRDAPGNTEIIERLRVKPPTDMVHLVIVRGDDIFAVEFACVEGLLS